MPAVAGDVVGIPKAQGLYNPEYESDACGVGYVVSIDGVKSHKVLRDAQTMLQRMEHRGACGCDNDTGDGAGVITAIPHELYAKDLKEKQNIDLPAEGKYATGLMFIDKDKGPEIQAIFQSYAEELGMKVLAWRNLPIDSSVVGSIALTSEPLILQE